MPRRWQPQRRDVVEIVQENVLAAWGWFVPFDDAWMAAQITQILALKSVCTIGGDVGTVSGRAARSICAIARDEVGSGVVT